MNDINFDIIFQENIIIEEIHKNIHNEIINYKFYKLSNFETKCKNYIKTYPSKIYKYPAEIEKYISYYNYIENERKIYFTNKSRLFNEFFNIDNTFSEYSIFLGKTSDGIIVLNNFINSVFYKKIKTFKNDPQDIYIEISSNHISEILSLINDLIILTNMIINIENKNICIIIIKFYLYILEKYYHSLKNDEYISHILNLNISFSPPPKKEFIDNFITCLKKLNIIKKEIKELIN